MRCSLSHSGLNIADHKDSPSGRPIRLAGEQGGAYLRFIDDIYRSDAYHSLSIEGYTVSPELIERVKAGNWDSDNHDADRQNRDALAARGYWQAFEVVKSDLAAIIAGANAGSVVRDKHRVWYRELFQPCVAAGLIARGRRGMFRLAGRRCEMPCQRCLI